MEEGGMGESIRVLHVDDDTDFAESAATFIEQENDQLTVETAATATDGFNRLTEHRFDCIISDHDTPETDGIEFLKMVREEHPDLPFILFTGKGSEAVASEAFSAGATDYLKKKADDSQYTILANRIVNAVDQYRSHLNYRRVFENLPDGIVIHDIEDGSFVDINSTYADLMEYNREELLTAGFESILPDEPDYRIADAKERIQQAVDEGPQTFEWPAVRKDGTRFWTEVHLTPIRLLGASRVLAVVRDITQRKEREEELREKSTILDAIFDRLPIHLYVKDDEARKVWVSGNFIDDPGAQIGKTDLELYPEEFSRQSYSDDMKVIETGESIIDKEEHVEYVDDWHLTSKVPWYDDEGEIQGLIGVTWEITERKKYEQELERQNERLEEFASLVSHDLRNPLNVASGRLELAKEDCESDHLDAIENAHDRMEALIEDVLTLTRTGKAVGETDQIPLESVITECWKTVDTADATIVRETDRTVQADPDRLKRLFENLFRNAVQHGGQEVTITIGDCEHGFYITDDGVGIPQEERDQIFESGYSTGEEGVGLGLSIVQEIVNAHGWEISVTESEDGGTRFEIRGVEFDE